MKLHFNKGKIIVFLFFLIFFITGLTIVKDYGAHWDEYANQDFGVHWYKYTYDLIINGGPIVPQKRNFLQNIHDIIHGPAIEMSFAFLADKLFKFEDSRDIILLRHYGTWFLFFISVIFFYLLCKLHLNSQMMALLGCLLLVLHPRIFSNSFYDSVDIAFLSLYIISMYTLVLYMKTKTLKMAMIHAFACAVLIDIRSIGVIIPFLTYILFLWQVIETRHDKKKVISDARNILVYTFSLALFVILLWPYLWRNPLLGIIDIIKMTPHILWNETVLYFGEYIKATQLPWHYIPVWIGITTPILYSFFFITGFIFILKNLFKKERWSSYETKNHFLFLCAFLLPIILVIVLNSTLYDSWRHLFFVYPAFVLVALIGINTSRELITRYCRGKSCFVFRVILTVSILISVLSTGIYMIKYHPYQNVYFNSLAGRDMKTIKDNFELDYWGLSYRQALENILKNDRGENIKVYDALSFGPMLYNIRILPILDRKRLVQVWTPEEAKYVLTDYRWHKHDYSYPNEPFSIKVGNAKIMSVFKLKD